MFVIYFSLFCCFAVLCSLFSKFAVLLFAVLYSLHIQSPKPKQVLFFSAKVSQNSFAGILRNFCGSVLLILMGLPTFFLIVEIIQGKINTEKQYFLMHNTSIYASIKLLFCKAANIIGEIQKVGNPERPWRPFTCCEGCQTIDNFCHDIRTNWEVIFS